MIRAADSHARTGKLEALLSLRAVRIRREAEELCGLSSRLRLEASRFEEAIRRFEARIRVHPPKGPAWQTLLDNLLHCVSGAERHFRRIQEIEESTLPKVREFIEQIRSRPEGLEASIPPAVIDLLELGAERRAGSIFALERSAAVASRIGVQNARSTAQDVLTLLDERRRALADSEHCLIRAEKFERRATGLRTGRILDVESAAVRAVGADEDWELAIRTGA